MGVIFDYLFSPPAFPGILLPPLLSAGMIRAVHEAFRLVYMRGVYDGFVAGAILSMLFTTPRCRCK